MRDQSCSDLLATLKTMNIYLGFSKVCGRLSPIIGSVHHIGVILDVDMKNRRYSEWRTASKDAKR